MDLNRDLCHLFSDNIEEVEEMTDLDHLRAIGWRAGEIMDNPVEIVLRVIRDEESSNLSDFLLTRIVNRSDLSFNDIRLIMSLSSNQLCFNDCKIQGSPMSRTTKRIWNLKVLLIAQDVGKLSKDIDLASLVTEDEFKVAQWWLSMDKAIRSSHNPKGKSKPQPPKNEKKESKSEKKPMQMSASSQPFKPTKR